MAAYTRNDGWRPRGGKPGGYRSRQTNRPAVDASFVLKDLEEKVVTFSVDDTDDTVRLRHPTAVASYSWVDAPIPTIAVPGSPRVWVDDKPVKQVPLDSGVQYVHHDGSKIGDRLPMVPVFAAIDAMHGDGFPYAEIDLITGRNGLRKLLRYIDQVKTEESFRIDVDLFGKTCLFTRKDGNLVVGHMGYGNEYLRAATRAPAECKGVLDYHRIVTYKFGSLKVLLWFTADACTEKKKEDDDLLASFASLNIGQKGEKTPQPSKPGSDTGVHVEHNPSLSLIPQSDLIEVKTRSLYRDVDWREIYPQLYLSQTAWLYMAKHERGAFQPADKIALTSEEMEPYAAMMEGSLGKLKQLLKAILKSVREQGEGVPMSLVHQDGKLSLWKRKEGSGKVISEDIISKFRREGKAISRSGGS